jgi:hypothetical protein
VLFAWDLWNEIHPAYAQDSGAVFDDFIGDLSRFLREHEMRVHGRAHPQTVSMFSPHIVLDPAIPDAIYRHADLDFCSTHLYEEGPIDHPKNTVDAAIRFGALTREAIGNTPAGRPYFDSEHGPIHTFKDHKITLPEKFDDEYFRHMQWAHLASGGAGGGMRWPNRHPHVLTKGMRREQRSLAGFVSLMDWKCFRREVIDVPFAHGAGFGCRDAQQAVLYFVRRDTLGKDGCLRRDVAPVGASATLPGMAAGCYRVTAWDTVAGRVAQEVSVCHEQGGTLTVQLPPFVTDRVVAVRRTT